MPRNPDRAIIPPNPAVAITLGEMAAASWQLVARCPRCRVTLNVDLPALIRLHGGDAVWWGRRPPCRVVDCDGRVVFLARSHKFGSWRSLEQRLSPSAIRQFRERRSAG